MLGDWVEPVHGCLFSLLVHEREVYNSGDPTLLAEAMQQCAEATASEVVKRSCAGVLGLNECGSSGNSVSERHMVPTDCLTAGAREWLGNGTIAQALQSMAVCIIGSAPPPRLHAGTSPARQELEYPGAHDEASERPDTHAYTDEALPPHAVQGEEKSHETQHTEIESLAEQTGEHEPPRTTEVSAQCDEVYLEYVSRCPSLLQRLHGGGGEEVVLDCLDLLDHAWDAMHEERILNCFFGNA